MRIIDCKAIADEWRSDTADRIERLGLKPKLTIVSVGVPDAASQIYVRNKIKACQECGIAVNHIILDDEMPTYRLCYEISELSSHSDGFILQLPVADGVKVDELMDAIDPASDVDCMTYRNIGLLSASHSPFVPATVKGIVHMLKREKIEIAGKDVCVIGRSNIVGKPLATVLTKLNATVTLCHSKTKFLANRIQYADIVISAVGQPFFITPEMIRDDTVLVDVGINRLKNGEILGDCCPVDDFIQHWGETNNITLTPVPRGVGLLTVAALMDSVCKACEMKQ